MEYLFKARALSLSGSRGTLDTQLQIEIKQVDFCNKLDRLLPRYNNKNGRGKCRYIEELLYYFSVFLSIRFETYQKATINGTNSCLITNNIYYRMQRN